MSDSGKPRVAAVRGGDVDAAIREVFGYCDILSMIPRGARVSIKPNLTYPHYKPGVTTSPAVIESLVRLLKETTSHIAIVETDGGYGAWRASSAFAGHGLFELRDRHGIEVVNLNEEEAEPIYFHSGRRRHSLPLPVRLLHETDVFITMPVPKIHAMTRVSLAFKNQWGCIPDPMRLRRHYLFADAILAINRRLNPLVLADGTYFLDDNGPMEGTAVREDLIIAATDPGAFCTYVCQVMGVPLRQVRHLRRAVALGDMPRTMHGVSANVPPRSLRRRRYGLRRTIRNYVALVGFRSRWVTWMGYESWFGRVVLHAILYAFVGRPPEREQ